MGDAGAAFDASVLDTMVGHLTRVVQVRLFQLYYERLRRLRVSPGAFAVLTAIRSNPGVQHGALADALGVHGPNMTKLVDRLVREGWVERRSAANDRRTKGHYLTTTGRAKAEAVLTAGLAHDKRVSSSLSAAERKMLLRLLAKLDRGLAARTR
ncbi:MAG: MarR family transcriptional regulator [Xanthobacteraceae bacterium]